MKIELYCGDVQIGVLPHSFLLADDGLPSFGNIVNSWALFTTRHLSTVPDSVVSKLAAALHRDTFQSVFGNADNFRINSGSQQLPEAIIVGQKQYYVLDHDAMDFGILELSLQEVSEYHAMSEQSEILDLVDANSDLLGAFLTSRITTGFTPAKRVVGPAVAAPATPPAPSTVGAARAVTITPKPAPTQIPDTHVQFDNLGGVTFASGFFGTKLASPVKEARSALEALLNR